MAVLNSTVLRHCCIFPAKASEEKVFLGVFLYSLCKNKKNPFDIVQHQKLTDKINGVGS